MKVAVTIQSTSRRLRRTLSVKKGTTCLDLARKLRLRPDVWLVIRRRRPIPIDATVNDGDRLEFLGVLSGG